MEYLKCDLCLESSPELNAISCGHNTCKDCIYKICLFNKKSLDTYSRPTDKKLDLKCLLCLTGTIKISKFEIAQILNEASYKREDSDKGLCSIHNLEPKIFCNECEIKMCPVCFLAHQGLPMFASHQPGNETMTVSKSIHSCSLHDKRPFSYFCSDCNTGLCEVCKMLHNEGHNLKLHKDVYIKKKEELRSQFVLPSRSAVEITKKLDDSDEQLKEEVNREVDRLKDKIKYVVDYLNETSRQLERERSIICEEIVANNTINKVLFCNLINDLEKISKSSEFDVNFKYLEKISKKNNLADREFKNELLPESINEVRNLIEKCSIKTNNKTLIEIKKKETASHMPSKSMTLTKSMLNYASKNPVLSSSTTLTGHNSVVNCIIQLNHGRIASASGDDTIKIWDEQDKFKNVQTLEGHIGCVYSLIQLKDGRLASGSENTIRIWDDQDNFKCIHILNGHTNGIYSFLQLEDGRMASASGDKTIRIWNPFDNFKCNSTITNQHTDSIYCLAMTKDGKVASGSFDKTVKILNPLNMFRAMHVLIGHTDKVSSLLTLQDGKLASGSYDMTIRIWDNEDSYKCIATITGHSKPVYSLTTLPDNRFASGSGDKTIRIWTPQESNKCNLVLVGHVNIVYSIINIEPDRLVSASADRTMRIWDLTNKIK